MAKAKKDISRVYVVRLEGHCPAYVQAESWLEATVRAAEFWGIPWGAHVAYMELEKTMEARKNVCHRCRRVVYGEHELCPACEKVRDTEREQAAIRRKKTWYLGRKDAAWGK